MQASAAIEARELTKTYGGGVRALDGLGFTVSPAPGWPPRLPHLPALDLSPLRPGE